MISNRLEQWRAQRGTRGISKAHLARQLGVSRSYITKLEQGKTVPSLVIALRLARYFQCKVEDLFELSELVTKHEPFLNADVLPNGHIRYADRGSVHSS